MSEILHLEAVTKRFGGLQAVSAASFSVNEGEILGIIGPNGAGKTTIFNLVVGLHKPTSGKITFKGREIQGLAPHTIARLGITKTFQTISLFNDMPILDNVVVGALLRRRKACDAIAEARLTLSKVGFDPDMTSSPADLGLVDRARLEVARALATQPSLLLLDEVMAGLTPTETKDAIEMIRGLRDQGITLMVVEHNMKAIMTLSDRIVAFNHGAKIAEGSPQEVSNHPDVIDSYLGADSEYVKA
ncbi:MAG: ABC transporter ATP-binding protein [Thermodesulfobacteriota bacterium]